MPNFDTGHYFLTTLAPIRRDAGLDERGVRVSHEQMIRTLLAILPTALQSPATEKIGINSPFSRNKRTHFCRFMVLDDVIYNGRTHSNAIATSIKGGNPAIPQKVDRLKCDYLMFVADFDAVLNDGDPLPATLTPAGQDAVRDAFANRLWETMGPEIREIYSHCVGFEEVNDAAGFADYIRRCQIETTMPFNDYWVRPPKLNGISLSAIAVLVGAPILVMLLGLAGLLFGVAKAPLLGMLFGWTSGWATLGGLLATVLAVFLAYVYTMRNGLKPMPPGEIADLPSVLKSLYLQQKFTEFAIETQGMAEPELHAAFGKFLNKHRPGDKMAPSQVPGVISIDRPGAVAN